MGIEGLENMPQTLGNNGFTGLGKAECEAIRTNAALRDLVRVWSTLDPSVQQAIVAIAQSATRE